MNVRKGLLFCFCVSIILFSREKSMSQVSASAPQSFVLQQPVTIPFELAGNHICVRVMVNSVPLWFVFDTGDKFGIIDIAKAKSLGLDMQGQVAVGGGGEDKMSGRFVKGGSFAIPGLDGFAHPILLALPLNSLTEHLGHDFDGIFGADFIKQFVVELDYNSKTMRLYDKEKFSYSGPGESIPEALNSAGHPTIHAQIAQPGRDPIEGTFVVDLGSGLSLILSKPFVESQHIVSPNQKTFSAVVGYGAGGASKGLVGRVESLKIGSYVIKRPVTVFSQDSKGAMASDSIQGNIGVEIMHKFKVILDYAHNRIILEPNSRFSEATEYDMSGLAFIAKGANYHEFIINDVRENTPASAANLRDGDVLISMDGKPATSYTLDQLHDIFRHEGQNSLSVRRGAETINVKLTLKREI